MKPALACLVAFVLGGAAAAQVSSSAAKPAPRAVIDGVVTKDPGGEPVKKALIEVIAENQAEGGDYTAVTGADGTFRVQGILPGRYHLFAERTGFLEVDKHHARSAGQVLTLTAGQELKDLQIRLQAAAVVEGRVTDEDGEPLPNSEVAVLRQTFAPGRSRWEQVGSERTNDLGEYRLANLPAGNYYVSVTPPPDFKSLIEAAGAAWESRTAASMDKRALSYQTTYYPGTLERSQAAAIQLHPGDDFPANFSLTPTPSLSIRGSVVNLPPSSSASIILQSRDFNVVNGAEIRKDGSFVIRDVAPGAYTILATVENRNAPMTARQSLQVAASVEGLRLVPQPGAWIRGRLRLQSKSSGARLERAFDPGQMFLALRPADGEDEIPGGLAFGDGFSQLTHVGVDGSFEWKNVPPGRYYVQFAGDGGSSGDWFLMSELAGGRDVDEAGVSVNGGAVVLDLVASADGAVVDGLISDAKGEAVANALVVAVPPARLRGQADRYRKTVSDQSGHFTLHAIPPGDYTLFAWERMDGEAYYNPGFLKTCEAQGSTLHLAEGEKKTMQLQAIPEAEEQP